MFFFWFYLPRNFVCVCVWSVKNSSLQNMCNTHTGKFFAHECAPIVFFIGVLLPRNLYGECLPVAIAQWGLITLGNYEVFVFPSVDDRRASSPRETMKWVFPKCGCPEGPRRQGKLWSECFPSVDAPRGLVAKGNYEVFVSQVSMPWGASSPRETV